MAKQSHPGRPEGVFGLLQHQLGGAVLPPWGCPPLAGGMAPFDMLCCAMQAVLCYAGCAANTVLCYVLQNGFAACCATLCLSCAMLFCVMPGFAML